MATKTKTISNIKSVIDKQRDFFESNATRDIDFRIEQLKKLKKAIQENEDNIYEALSADFKKSKFELLFRNIFILHFFIEENLTLDVLFLLSHLPLFLLTFIMMDI